MVSFLFQFLLQNYLNLWKEYNRIELEREYKQFTKSSYAKFDSLTYGDEIKLYFYEDKFWNDVIIKTRDKLAAKYTSNKLFDNNIDWTH